MEKYFIIQNKIEKSDIDLNEINDTITKLTAEQVAFYLANPTATVSEIINCAIYMPTPKTAEQIIEEICTNYQRVEEANITAIGAVQLKDWVAANVPMAVEVADWFTTLYTERATKIAAVQGGDLTVDTMPTSQTKPHTFYEIMQTI